MQSITNSFKRKQTIMELLHWFCFVCVLSCSQAVHPSEQSAVVLSSCQNMLEYQREGNDWVGLVQVRVPVTKTTQLELMLSLLGRLPSQYVGSIEPYGTKLDAVREIQSNQLVRYRVRFPLPNPLPKLTQVSVNGQVHCTDVPQTGTLETRIRLEYTLFTGTETAHPKPEQLLNLHTPQQTSNTSQSETEICGRPHTKNSETVTREAWPWIVAIRCNKPNGTSIHCGGILVSARTVVTAASCFRTAERTYQANEVMLFLGRNNILDGMEAGGKTSTVEQLVIHSDYMLKDSSSDADIAIAVMRERVEFTEYILPICLWKGSNNLNNVVGLFGTVVGWGTDEIGNIVTPGLIKIKLPVVSEAQCLRSSDTYRYILSERTFCAGSRDGRGPCTGDSGAAMTFEINNKWFLRGIFSGSLTNICDLGEYSVFSDAAKFVDWIKSNMR